MGWVRGLDGDALRSICKDCEAFRAAEERWLADRPRAKTHREKKEPAQRKNVTVGLRFKISYGVAFSKWRKTDAGRASRCFLVDFIRWHTGSPAAVKNKAKQYLLRCAALAAKENASGANSGECNVGQRMKPTMAQHRTPARHLKNPRGAGPRRKGGPLSEQLYDWFLDNRASVIYNLPPKYLMMQAVRIANETVQAMGRTGHTVPMPILVGDTGRMWLTRWCRDW